MAKATSTALLCAMHLYDRLSRLLTASTLWLHKTYVNGILALFCQNLKGEGKEVGSERESLSLTCNKLV